MKLFLTVLVSLVAFSNALDPKLFMIVNPNFLFETANTKFQESQAILSNFEKAVFSKNGVVTEVVGSSATESLEAYHEHSKIVIEKQKPIKDALKEIPEGDCHDTLLQMLDNLARSAGSRASLCLRRFHVGVKGVSDDALGQTNGLNEQYIEFSQFIYQSFSAKNAITSGEAIEQHIKDKFDQLSKYFNIDPVDNEQFKQKVAEIVLNLKKCFGTVEKDVEPILSFAKDQVNECKELASIPNVARASRSKPKNFMPQFMKALENFEQQA